MRDNWSDTLSDWPTRGDVLGAFDVVERLYFADGSKSAVPRDCRVVHWRLPSFVYKRLSRWAILDQRRVAVPFLGLDPAVTIMGWILELAGHV